MKAIQDDNVDFLQLAYCDENLADILLLTTKEARIAELRKFHQFLLLLLKEVVIKSLQYLIGSGSALTVTDSKNRSIAHFAAAGGHIDMVEYLENMNINFETPDSRGGLPIFYTSMYGNLDVFQLFFVKNLNLECVDLNQDTLLHACALSGNLELVKFFLNSVTNADINAKSLRSFTPLSEAILSKSLEVVQFFIENKAIQDPPENYTNLFFICM